MIHTKILDYFDVRYTITVKDDIVTAKKFGMSEEGEMLSLCIIDAREKRKKAIAAIYKSGIRRDRYGEPFWGRWIEHEAILEKEDALLLISKIRKDFSKIKRNIEDLKQLYEEIEEIIRCL